MWREGTRREPDGVLPATGVGQEEVEEEVVLSMGIEGTVTDHGTLGAAEYPFVGTSRIVPIIGMARQRESLFEIPMRGTDLTRSSGREAYAPNCIATARERPSPPSPSWLHGRAWGCLTDEQGRFLGVVSLEEVHLAAQSDAPRTLVVAADFMRTDVTPLQPDEPSPRRIPRR